MARPKQTTEVTEKVTEPKDKFYLFKVNADILESSHHNPALLEWPTDPWGLTSDLKKAMLQLTSRINGSPDKKAIADQVIAQALAYYEVRYERERA